MNCDKLIVFGVGGLVVLVVIGVLVRTTCLVSVDKGHVGVKSWFGDLEDGILEPGIHFVNPLKRVYHVNTQTANNEEPSTVPTKSGLAVSVKAVMLYRVDAAKAPSILREVGQDYEKKVINPLFRNAVRDAAAEFEPEALYTSERTRVEQMVIEKVTKDLTSRGFVVEGVMLQDPVLPKSVSDRIEAKVAAEQDTLRMQSVLKTRELEARANARQYELEAEGNLKKKELDAKAKVVEAEGIAKAQQIIKKDLDHNYLVYLWISALHENKGATIYVPTGPDGLPFFKTVEGKR